MTPNSAESATPAGPRLVTAMNININIDIVIAESRSIATCYFAPKSRG